MINSSSHQNIKYVEQSTEMRTLEMPAAPRLKAQAAPAEFQSFNMCQVEQAMSNHGFNFV